MTITKHKTGPILLVEDERRYRMLVGDALRFEGYLIGEADSGQAALDLACGEDFALVILDLMLPDMDGFELFRRLREITHSPVIMVTGRSGDRDKVRGLDLGADDYLAKPFSVLELLARVRAALRRPRRERLDEDGLQLQFGDMSIDSRTHTVMIGTQLVNLSPIEYRLLWFLATNAGRVLVPSMISEYVWGMPDDGMSGTLKTTMGRLRDKIGDDSQNPKYIKTRRGIGYVFLDLRSREAG